MNRILLLTYGRPRPPVAPSGDVTIQSDLRLRPTSEFPSNPYWIARLALGKEPTSERELEAAFGMPMKALLARSGPLFGPDIGELIKQIRSRVRPSGAAFQSKIDVTQAMAANKVSAQTIGATWGLTDRRGILSTESFPVYDRVADAASQAREQMREQSETHDSLSASGPTLLSQLRITFAQWQNMPCQEQVDALRRLVAPSVPSTRDLLSACDAIDRVHSTPGWIDPVSRWASVGAYAESPVSVLDACQGGIGNCYFISTLAGIAWIRPDIITSGSWRGGSARVPRSGQQTFTFNQPASNPVPRGGPSGGPFVDFPPRDYTVSVTASVPVFKDDTGTFWCTPTYGHGVVPSQSWPAMWEKAVAKMIGHDPSDRPNMRSTAFTLYFPNAVLLAGGGATNIEWFETHTRTRPASAEDVWRYLVEHCDPSGKVTSVLGADSRYTAPGDVRGGAVSETANIVGAHVYTVLGIAHERGRRLVALRNPWGNMAPIGGDGREEWMGLRIGQGGVGMIDFNVFVDTFLGITGNWYGTPRFGDIVPPNYR